MEIPQRVVYVVESWVAYEGSTVIKCFSSKKKATEYIKEQEIDNPSNACEGYDLSEWLIE